MIISEQDTLVINQVFKDFDNFLKDNRCNPNWQFNLGVGLCANIFGTLEELLKDITLIGHIELIQEKLFNSWEHFTGCYFYPVPFRLDKQQDILVLHTVEEEYYIPKDDVAYSSQYNLYDKTNDYGLLRRDLYQHIKDNIFNVISEI